MEQASDVPTQAPQVLKGARFAHIPGVSPYSGLPPPVEHRWKPGQSGNPRGRPVSAELDRRLLDKQTVAKIVDSLLQRIQDGDTRAIELLWDRAEGKLTQKVESDNRQTIVVEQGMEETPP